MNLPDPEIIAAAVHDSWMEGKRAHGVASRLAENGEELMVPYSDLSEKQKDMDRGIVKTVYDAIAKTPQPTSGLSFGQAIEALKAGNRVAREGWNGKGMWLSLIPEGATDHPGFPPRILTQPYIAMKTVQNTLVPWLASQTDMLAEDWAVVSC